ncbi:sensor histidine kinase [Sphingomonas koreensis]
MVVAVLATSAIFALATFVFAYAVEDQMFVRALRDEVARQQQGWRRDGVLPEPELAYVRIYRDGADLPADLRFLAAANSEQVEFSGKAGRHYHVARFRLDDRMNGITGGPAIAVAEVSRYLLVRPQRGMMIALLAGLGLLIAALMALLGAWLAHRAVAPLTQLARDVARAGNAIPEIRASDYPRNEIGSLAGALEQAFQRIRNFVDRERAFTRDASHELRTPIAVVRGARDVIALRSGLPAPIPDALRRIETAVGDMTQTLDVLLSLAREGEVLHAEPALLRPLVESAVADARERFAGNRNQVSIDVPPDLLVTINAPSFRLILNNLIGNSLQHTRDGAILIRANGQSLVIADDGPGLGDTGDPFKPFSKGADSTGSGLGLDIVRRLGEASGIALSYRTDQPGRGTRVLLTFAAS